MWGPGIDITSCLRCVYQTVGLVLILLILSDLVACVPFLFILACNINNIRSFRNLVNYATVFYDFVV